LTGYSITQNGRDYITDYFMHNFTISGNIGKPYNKTIFLI